MRRIVLLIALAALFAAPVGCSEQQRAEMQQWLAAAKVQLAAGRADLELTQEQRTQLAAAIAVMPEGPEKERLKKLAEGVDTAIEETKAFLLTLEEATRQMEQRMESAEDGFDVAAAAVASTAPFLPPPWNGLALGFGGLAIGLVRAGYNRAKAINIARSVQPVLPEMDEATKAKVRAMQGTGGGRIVDEAQGKARRLPF